MDKHHSPDATSEFPIETRNEAFEAASHLIADRNVTGAQIAHMVKAQPVADFAVIAHLRTGATETLRPEEIIDLADPAIERFFIMRADSLFRFNYGDLSMEWPQAQLSGEQLRLLCKIADDDELMLSRQNLPDEEIGDDDVLDLSEPGVERLYSRRAKPHITIYVDAEPYEPLARKMAPNQIIVEAAQKDPNENYLVRITKHGNVSYQGKGDDPVRLKDGMQFQVVFTGPTPVSDGSSRTGVAAFIQGLAELGCDPKQMPGHSDHVHFRYEVPTGKFIGTKLRLGIIVPHDFPMTPPTGPYVSPCIHPNSGGTNAGHPLSNITDASGSPFGKLGGEWQYWSRPHAYWGKTKKNVAAYMSHIWQLWETQ